MDITIEWGAFIVYGLFFLAQVVVTVLVFMLVQYKFMYKRIKNKLDIIEKHILQEDEDSK
jgi:hypothetical protein